MKKRRSKRATKRSVSHDKDPSIKIGSSVMNEIQHRRWYMALIGALAILLYVNTFDAGFALDDHLLIINNNFTVKGLEGIPDILTNDMSVGYFGRQINMAGIHYRPIPQIFFALQYEFFGNDAMAGHIFNSLCYAFLCILLFLTLLRLLSPHLKEKTLPVVLASTLIFTAHPIHTDVVANIKSLDEILALMGAIGALFFSLKFYASKKYSYLVWAALSFLVGIFSKENALTFLMVIPLSLFLFRKPKQADYLKIMSPLAAVTIVLFLIRRILLEGSGQEAHISEFLINPFIDASGPEHLATLIYSWGLYLVKLIIPLNLTTDYFPFAIPIMNWSDWQVWLSFIMLIGLIAIIIKWRKKQRVIWYSFLFFIITFSLTSNLFFFSGSPMSERFMFMPSVGFALAMGSIGYHLINRFIQRKDITKWAGLICLCLVIGLFSAKTITRNLDWQTEQTLILTDVETSSESSKANVSAAYFLIRMAGRSTDVDERGRLLDEAEKHLQAAIRILPDNYQAYEQWTKIHKMRGDQSAAAQSERTNQEIRSRLLQEYRRRR